VKLKDFCSLADSLVPPSFAEDWDNVGLQLGEPERRVRRILLALDMSEKTLEKARRLKCDLIIAHHPLIFHPLPKIDLSEAAGHLIAGLIRSKIALFVMHTNLDSVEWGTSDALARKAGLVNIEVLSPALENSFRKLVVFVPRSHLEKVRSKISEAGAGRIGKYSECSWRVLGKGTFKPVEGASPALGSVGRLEEVEEYRLEAVLPKEALPDAIRALREAHPYEEPAFDIYPLEMFDMRRGLGKIGSLPGKMTGLSFARKVAGALGVKEVKVSGDSKRNLRRVAVLAGSAGRAARLVRGKADTLLVGEIGYHDRLEAEAAGLCVISVGHPQSERAVLPVLRGRLKEVAPALAYFIAY